MEFRKVWFRSQPQASLLSIPAYEDVGSLTINDHVIEYKGKKSELRIRASRIERVIYGKQGIDWINNWVTVEWDRGRQALFNDGGLLGWAGIFGRTRRIYDRIAWVALVSSRKAEVRRLDQLSSMGRIIRLVTIVYCILSLAQTVRRWFAST